MESSCVTCVGIKEEIFRLFSADLQTDLSSAELKAFLQSVALHCWCPAQELKALMGTMWSPSRLNTTTPSAESKREKSHLK